MAKLDIKLNSNIELIYEGKEIKTTVQYVDDKEFGIMLINDEGSYLLLETGMTFEVKAYTDDCIYSFDSKVTRRSSGDTEENVPLFYFTIPTEIKRIQRRRFVRAFFTEEFSFFNLSEEKINKRKDIIFDIDNQDVKKAIVLDMSGGGVRFISPIELETGKTIFMDIPTEKDKVLVEGKVMWCRKDDRRRILCGVNFENMPEAERDKIINKTFDIIRKQRRTQ